MFQVGDKVVYPGHGVAMVECIVEKTVESSTLRFFKLKFLYKDMTALVPIDSDNEAVGVRALSSEEQVKSAMDTLLQQPRKLDATDFTPSSWNKRNKNFQLKLQSGSLTDIATIYRDLMYCARYKELSFGEKNLLGVAEELLLQEVVIALRKSREEAIAQIRAPFQQYGYDDIAHVQRAAVR